MSQLISANHYSILQNKVFAEGAYQHNKFINKIDMVGKSKRQEGLTNNSYQISFPCSLKTLSWSNFIQKIN